MTTIRHTGRYIGGPLDGSEALPVRGRWSIYRTDGGDPLKAAQGDREFIYRHNAGQPMRRYYVHNAETPQTVNEDGTVTREHLYIHAAHYRTWRTQRAEARRTA